jgi:hypothetical protein
MRFRTDIEDRKTTLQQAQLLRPAAVMTTGARADGRRWAASFADGMGMVLDGGLLVQ